MKKIINLVKTSNDLGLENILRILIYKVLIKSNIYGFNSLSISDTFIKKSALFSITDLSPDLDNSRDIGWVIKHSDLMNVFFQEIDSLDNIFFNSCCYNT